MGGGARCAVASCSNSYRSSKKRGLVLSLHSFPKDTELRTLWVEACSRLDPWNPDTSLVCSDHFTLDDFEADQRLQLWTGVKWNPRLKPGAIPTRNLPICESNDREPPPPEPHKRCSMFQVLTSELEIRQDKTNENHTENNSGNAISADSDCDSPESPNVMADNPVETAVTANDTNCCINEIDTIQAEIGNTVENHDSREMVYPLNPSKKSRIEPCAESPKSRATADGFPSKTSEGNGSNGESLCKEKPSSKRSSVLYACSTFDLFVDD